MHEFCISKAHWTHFVFDSNLSYEVMCVCLLCLDDFKKMYMQKFKEAEKAYTKQVKEIKALKRQGKTRANAVSFRPEPML